MSTDPILGLTNMPGSILKNEDVYNGNLVKQNALIRGYAISRGVLDPSALSPLPVNGDVYIVPDGSPAPTGVFAGRENAVAVYYNGFRFQTALAGMTMWLADEAARVLFSGSVWGLLTDESLAGLTDVDLTGSPAPADGDALVFDATASPPVWVHGAGGASGAIELGSFDMSVDNATTSEDAALQIAGMADYKTIIFTVKGIDPAETSGLRMRFLALGGTVGVTGIYDGGLSNNGSTQVGYEGSDQVLLTGNLNPIAIDNIHGTIVGHANAVTPTVVASSQYDNDTTGSDKVGNADYVTSALTLYDGVSFFTSTGTIVQGIVTVYGCN